jgi:hypothetical protein
MNVAGNNTDVYCELKKCFKWNEDEGKCEGTGSKYISAIVLQSIPVTGIFGAGFGNIGRWDWFGIVFGGIWCGGFILICCCIGITSINLDANDLVTGITTGICISLFGCLWSIAIIAMWIYGIVVIANKDILGGNGCILAS